MGINSENNNENLKQQEAMANAIDGATAGAQQFANATEAAGKAGKKMTGSLSEITEGIDDFSEGLDKALKSIHLLPGAIEEYTKIANKNMAYAAEDIREGFIKGIFNEKLWAVRAELGRETEELKIAMEQAEKSMKQAEASNDEYEKHTAKLRYEQLASAYTERKNMKVSQQLNKKLAYDMKTELLKIGKQMFSDLWSYAKKILDEAYAKDKSTIEQNYGTIMSYNSYNHGEYAKLIDRLQEKIDASGLGDVISINTLQENLTKTMQSGLQGALAESNAYYASIAEKAGITFDWYGSEWTTLISQMNRTGKDYEKVMKSVISTTDDLAEIYGDSKGLSEGRANQMMAAASSLGTTYGLSEDAIGNIYKSLAVTSQELTNYGIDTNNFVQDITGALQSGLSNHDLGVIFGTGGATGDQVEQKIKEGKFDELIVQYMDNLEMYYKDQNSEMVHALQDALGSSFSTTDYQAFQTYWEQEGSFSTNFEKAIGKSTSSVEDIEGELKDYVTTQESYETRMENYLADIAEVMVQNPILEVISKTLQSGFATIGGILIGWGGKQLLNKVLPLLGKGDSSGSGSLFNLGKSLFSSKGAGAAANAAQPYSGQALANFGGTTAKAGGLSKLGSLFTNGTAFASKGGTLAKVGSKVFSTGGKALGVAGSLISMGIDGYQGYKEDGWAGAARGAITGSGKIAENGWDVAKGTGSAALKGAGIGMVFGPWGAAIGAAVGAVAGLTTTLIDLNDEEKQFQLQVEKANTYFNDLSKSTEELANKLNNVEQTKSTLAESKKLIDTLKEGQEPAAELMNNFGEYNIYLDKNGRTTQAYIEKLKTAIETQEALNEIEKQKLIKQGNDNIYGASSKYNTLLKDIDKKEAVLDKAITKRDTMNEIKTNFSKGNNVSVTEDYSTLDINGVKYKMSDIAKMMGMEGESDESIFSAIAQSWGRDYLQNGGTIAIEGSASHVGWHGSKDTGSAELLFNKDNSFAGTMHIGPSDYYKFNPAEIEDGVSSAYTEYGQATSKAATANNTRESWINTTFMNYGLQSIKSADDFANWQLNNSASLFSNYFGAADEKGSFKNAFGHYNNYLTDLMNEPNADKSAIKKQYESITPSKFKEYFLETNPNLTWSMVPAFAVGTPGDSTIPYDNYLALLHKGEQIRTSAEVALEEANKHIASSTTSKAIHDVVLNQTNTIISILTNIYNVITSGRGTMAPTIERMAYDLPGI